MHSLKSTRSMYNNLQVFSKVPFLHRDWHSVLSGGSPRFLLGPGLCLWTQLADCALSMAPHVALCFYLGHAWLRVRRRRTPTRQAEEEEEATAARTARRSAFKDAALLIAAAAGWSAAVAAVVAYRMKMDYRWSDFLCPDFMYYYLQQFFKYYLILLKSFNVPLKVI